MQNRNPRKPKSILPMVLPSFGRRGGRGFCRRPYVGPKLGTGNAENGLITQCRFHANVSEAMKMEPNRLVS